MLLRLFQSRISTLVGVRRLSTNISSSLWIENCWLCQRLLDRNECTTHCSCEKHVLLPVRLDIDYFHLFHLPRTFEIDTTQLTKEFRNKMKSLHPDLFTNRSDTEKTYSQDQSAQLNQAYSTLRSPLARAHYLLKLENITLEDSPVILEPEFLMRIMEINEQLAEDDKASDQRSFPIELALEMRQEIDNHMKQLSEALTRTDMVKAKELLARLQYFSNIDEKLSELELKHGIV